MNITRNSKSDKKNHLNFFLELFVKGIFGEIKYFIFAKITSIYLFIYLSS